MNGSNLTLKANHENVYKQQPCLSISQLLVYNTYKRRRQLGEKTFSRHSKNREPPLPVYIGLLIHSQTRQSNLVCNLHDIGISISYDRVLEIENEVAYAMCEQYKTKGVLCPPNLRKTLFTTSAYRNIDHTPSSTTAKESFRGTGISVFQHPDSNNSGYNLAQTPFSNSLPKQKVDLPAEYTTLLPVSFLKKDVLVPEIRGWQPKDDTYTAESTKIEMYWLSHVVEAMQNGGSIPLSWSAYSAKYATNVNIIKSISSMLPLFKEDSHSVTLMIHAFKLIKKVTDFLYPGQTPVMIFDQPLYAVAKNIQWNMPERYGEDKLVVMLGGLHIEWDFWP